jgi:serine/threonine-protein phosphatase 6 regulatory ankyrin repeat subunit B
MEIEWKTLFDEYERGQKEQIIKRFESLTTEMINTEDKNGDFPLILSCKRCIYELGALLIQKGAQVDIQDNNDNLFSPLFYACERNSIDMVRLLLDNGASINQVNEEELSAFQIVCQYGYKELAHLLIQRGADINHKDQNMNTPLYYACSTNQFEMVKFLVENNIDLNISLSYQFTDLFYFTFMQNILIFLLKVGAEIINEDENLNEKTPNYKSLLDASCQFGHRELLEYLIEEKGVNLNTTIVPNITLLVYACENDQYEIVEYLIKKGADIDPFDSSSLYSPLISKHLGLVKLLVENGANKYKLSPYSNASCFEYANKDKEISSYLAMHIIIDFYNLLIAKDFESACMKSIQTFEAKNSFILKKEFLEALKVIIEDAEISTKINEQNIELLTAFSNAIDQIKEKLKSIICPRLKYQISHLSSLFRQFKVRYVELNMPTWNKVTDEYEEDNENKNISFSDLISLSATGKLYEIIDSEKTSESKLDKTYSYFKLIKNCIDKHEDCYNLTLNLIRFLEEKKANIIESLKKIIADNKQLQVDNWDEKRKKIEQNSNLNSPLIIAVANERLELVNFLTNKHIKTEEDLRSISDQYQNTFLFMLAKCKAQELIIELIKKFQINLDFQTEKGETLLHMAIYCRLKMLFHYLVESDANFNLKNKSGDTCLSLACHEGCMSYVKLLISKGADINCRDGQGKTPIMRALDGRLGYNIAEFLINNGADVNARDNRGNSVLSVICQMGEEKLAKLLIEKGADINCSTENEESCFLLACNKFYFDSVVDLMIQRGVNMKQILNTNNSVAQYIGYIKRSQNHHLIQLLIENANLNEKNKDGSTVLHSACEHVHFEMVKLLVDKGADVNALNKDNETPLHKCFAQFTRSSEDSKHIEIINFLIEKGADLSIRNKKDQSYLTTVCTQNPAYNTAKKTDELKKIFRNRALIDLKNVFNYKDISAFRHKVVESINNQNLNSFVLSWDHVRAFKLLDLDKESPSANDFKDLKTFEYLSSFQFKEKLLEDVLNNLKGEKERLNMAKLKIDQSFAELNEIQTDHILIDYQLDYSELKCLISEQDLINHILIEESLFDKSRKKAQLLRNIDHFLLSIEERILIANCLSELVLIKQN